MSSDALPDDPGTLKAMLLAERMQNERLRQIIKELQRHRFGRRAETLPEDQMLLVEQSLAGDDAAKPMTPARTVSTGGTPSQQPGFIAGAFARVEMIVDIDDKTRPCCQRELHCIGEDRSERLDTVPAQFRVLVTVRPKYACHKWRTRAAGRGTRPADRRRNADRRDRGARRGFYELATPGPSPTASEALQLIAELYAVEKEIRGRSADERRLVRQQKSSDGGHGYYRGFCRVGIGRCQILC